LAFNALRRFGNSREHVARSSRHVWRWTTDGRGEVRHRGLETVVILKGQFAKAVARFIESRRREDDPAFSFGTRASSAAEAMDVGVTV